MVMNEEAETSERFRQARELLRDKGQLLDVIMDSMGDGLSIQDLDMRLVFQNRFMVEVFGSHSGEFCHRTYEKRDTVCEGCPIQEAYKDGETHRAARVGIAQDGTPFRFDNVASVLRDEHGQVVAGMELCKIVEETERAKDELRASRDELAAKVAALEELNRSMTNRELRMIDLKHEVDELLDELGEPRRYAKLADSL